MGLTGKNNEEKIWNYLIGKGLSRYGTAGLMGNLYAESGLRPENLQNSFEAKLGYTDDGYTAAVDSGAYKNFVRDSAGYGLAQWTYWSRKQNMLEFARAAGKSIGDLEMQLDFLFKELSEGYKSVLAALKAATTVKAASDSVLLNYERPADQSEAVKTKRAGYGQIYYDRYAGAASKPTANTGGTNMGKTKISNSGHDENGRYSGGTAGDQTGTEWQVIDWYNRPWNCVLRHPDAKVRALLAELAREAAYNNHIGYDQYQRDTFWQQLQKAGYHPKNIKVNCESDCSAGVIAMAKAVGHLLGITKLKNLSATYTGNMRAGFKAAGFEVLTAAKYISGSSYLLAGDILLNDNHHTAVNLTNGDKIKAEAEKPTTPATGDGHKVGDIVDFTGNRHYASADAASGPSCKPGKAKVTQVYQPSKSKHPYHLVAVNGGGSTVYGWVNASDINGSTAPAYETYTVRKGDSLWAIAAKQLGNGSRYKEIKSLNGLTSDTIYAGQKLKLPN